MDKEQVREIEQAIFARLDQLVRTAGKAPVTTEFIIDAAKVEVTLALAPYKV